MFVQSVVNAPPSPDKAADHELYIDGTDFYANEDETDENPYIDNEATLSSVISNLAYIIHL